MGSPKVYRIRIQEYRDAWIGLVDLDVDPWLPPGYEAFEDRALMGEIVEGRKARSPFGAAVASLEEHFASRRRRLQELNAPAVVSGAFERRGILEALHLVGPSEWRYELVSEHLTVSVEEFKL